ncbi:unnamed protein product [Polarella glacialis]|uniref:Uncharacterized protein n=1 Tax=Polarella glacialis TaxID=89957 RepID=A0A813JVT6_POLGL|nr:unnamed protein product [Polarella glacialis]CAE8687070.1 unnamed protein product [Polarella glacialis]
MSTAAEWCSFGRGQHGELGRKVVTEGVEIPGLENADVRPLSLGELRSVSCGHFHCLALTGEGKALAWGANSEGQLGIAGSLGEEVFVSSPSRALGSCEERLAGETIASCAAGRSHSVFVSSPNGRCFISGRFPMAEPGLRSNVSGPADSGRQRDSPRRRRRADAAGPGDFVQLASPRHSSCPPRKRFGPG